MDNPEIQIKKILYRAIHRGCKETDFLLGNYFKFNQSQILDLGLDLCDKFLSQDDMLIYDWILGKIDTPKEYKRIVEAIRVYHKI